MDVATSSSSSAATATATDNHETNIWDSAWHACTQAAPPSLTEVLGAYAAKGDGDRDMLLGILKAKSAEDQRIAAVASLHQTILQLQAQTMLGANGAGLLNGLTTPTATPPVYSPPPPTHTRQRPSISSHHHHSPPPALQSSISYVNQHTSSAYPSGSNNPPHPTLPPISTIQSSSSRDREEPRYDEPRKRSRVSSDSSSSSSHRPSPEYPLSPYSAGSGRSPRHQHAAPATAVPPRPTPYPLPQQGRLAVSSLLGNGMEEDGDVRYRRMSAERSTR